MLRKTKGFVSAASFSALASMRPQRNAAENAAGAKQIVSWPGFNEAAA